LVVDVFDEVADGEAGVDEQPAISTPDKVRTTPTIFIFLTIARAY
jgi:hypothetical protein